MPGPPCHLRENEQLADLPPAAVQLWGRHFAYAGVMGVAPTAVALLPFGTEDDNGAWSRFGGRWRRVRVRYPRGWPPGWGKHPGFATFLAVLWGAAAVAALYGLRSLAQSAADPITATDPLFDRDQLDWIGRGALLLMIPVALVLLWSIFLLVRAVPDFWRTRTTTRRAGAGPASESDLPVEQPQQPAVLVLPRPRRRNAPQDQVRGGCGGTSTTRTRRARRSARGTPRTSATCASSGPRQGRRLRDLELGAVDPLRRELASTRSAIATNTCDASPSGSVTTIGRPSSPPSRSSGTSGTWPSSGTSSCSASSCAAAGAEQLVALAVVAGEPRHVLDDALDLEVDLLGHERGALRDLLRGGLRRGDDETSARGRNCASDSEMSPVPGGRSTRRKSGSSQ